MQIQVKEDKTCAWVLNDYMEDDDVSIKFRCTHNNYVEYVDYGDEENISFDCPDSQCQGIDMYELDRMYDNFDHEDYWNVRQTGRSI